VTFALEDAPTADGLAVALTNKDHFQSTGWLRLRWRLLADGLPLSLAGADNEGWADVQHEPVPAQVHFRMECLHMSSCSTQVVTLKLRQEAILCAAFALPVLSCFCQQSTRVQGSGTVQLPLSGEQLAAAVKARKDLRGVSGARALLETRAELAADAPWAGKVLFDQQICAVLVLFNSFSMHVTSDVSHVSSTKSSDLGNGVALHSCHHC